MLSLFSPLSFYGSAHTPELLMVGQKTREQVQSWHGLLPQLSELSPNLCSFHSPTAAQSPAGTTRPTDTGGPPPTEQSVRGGHAPGTRQLHAARAATGRKTLMGKKKLPSAHARAYYTVALMVQKHGGHSPYAVGTCRFMDLKCDEKYFFWLSVHMNVSLKTIRQ